VACVAKIKKMSSRGEHLEEKCTRKKVRQLNNVGGGEKEGRVKTDFSREKCSLFASECGPRGKLPL